MERENVGFCVHFNPLTASPGVYSNTTTLNISFCASSYCAVNFCVISLSHSFPTLSQRLLKS